MSDDQARGMRPETTSEHIARDMREGRFPEQSERQMVPVLASLPDEIQVWRSMDTLDHMGTWSTTRYPAEAVTYVPRADAQAAVALVVERAVEAAYEADSLELSIHGANVIAERILALSPADGLAAVEELRAERDALAERLENEMADLDAADRRNTRLAAELAAAKQREAELLAALEDPLVVHLNMVAGKIAKPLPSQLAHIYGEDVIAAVLAEVQARDDASTPPDTTWHERRTMLPDGDARKDGGK